MKLVNIGFGNTLNTSSIVAIVSPDSAPIKRIIQESKDKGTLIDATQGRRTRAVIIMESDHIVLSYLQCETLSHRINNEEDEIVEEPDDE